MTRPPSNKSQPNPSPLVGEGFLPRSCASKALRKSHGGKGEGEQLQVVAKAKSLRGRMTDAERKLWYMLRNRRFIDAKFRRPVPLGRYVADFLSFEKKVVVEVDGGQHSGKRTDVVRDNWFRTQGFTVLRFWNNDVLKNLEGVFTVLAEVIDTNTPHPARTARARSEPPSPTRGEGKGSSLPHSTRAAHRPSLARGEGKEVAR